MKTTLLVFFFLIGISLYSQNTDSTDECLVNATLCEMRGENDAALYYYKKAAELDPLNYGIYKSWVILLVELGETAPIYYLECGNVYAKMIELSPANPVNYNDWGCCLLRVAKYSGNFKIYASKIESLFIEAEQLSDQLGAYNLVCLYSLLNDKKKARKWLEILLSKDYTMKDRRITKNAILNESDFKNIKDDKKFNEILDKYFPR